MELAIDSVGQVSSVAVSERGRVLAEITWPDRATAHADAGPADRRGLHGGFD